MKVRKINLWLRILFHYLVWLLGFGLTVFRGSILFSCQENTFLCILKNKQLAHAFKISFSNATKWTRIENISFISHFYYAPENLVLIRNLLSKQRMLYRLMKNSNSRVKMRICTWINRLHHPAQFIKLSFKGRPS
jgi:hypothetical protein